MIVADMTRTNNKNKIKQYMPAILVNLVLFKSLPSKIALLIFGGNAESVTTAGVVIFAVVYYLYAIFRQGFKLKLSRAHLVIIFALVYFGISIIMSYNDIAVEYFTFFIRYVLIALLMMFHIEDFDKLIKVFCIFEGVNFILLGFQPIINSSIFIDYMDYGVHVAIPVSIALFTARKWYEKKILLLPEIVSYVLLVIFANRAALLCIVTYIFLYILLIEKASIKKLLTILLSFGAVFIVSKNISAVLDWLSRIATVFGYNSYSLHKYQILTSGSIFTNDFFAGRMEIYSSALETIKVNLILGGGIGFLETNMGYYVHSIILDVLLSGGIIALLIFVLVFVKIIRNIILDKNQSTKLYKLIVLCLWFPRLLLSGSFYYDVFFWLSVMLSFMIFPRPNSRNDNLMSAQQQKTSI